MNKIIQAVRQLQEIDPEDKIICPICGNPRVKINGWKWSCSCGKGGDILELLRLVEEDYLSSRPFYYWGSRTNQGVGY